MKTLQYLARKYKGHIKFYFYGDDADNFMWYGEFRARYHEPITSNETTFNGMLQNLYSKTRVACAEGSAGSMKLLVMSCNREFEGRKIQ